MVKRSPVGIEPEAKVLLILPERAEMVYLSQCCQSQADSAVNIYDLLNTDKIVTTTAAIEKIQEVYSDQL